MVRHKALTDKQYWSSIWKRNDSGRLAVWETDPAVQQQSAVIASLISRLQEKEETISILEVGCANSFWLPHLARRFNATVYGVDYSEIGCKLAEKQMARQEAKGRIFCQDFFFFAESTPQRFDLIISFGFIEHFTDPSEVLKKMCQILVPGGFVFATVPNLLGIYGPLSKIMDRQVYLDHLLMDPIQIKGYAEKAGLAQLQAGYIGGMVYFSVLNFQTANGLVLSTILYVLCRAVRLFDIVAGQCLNFLGLDKNNKFTSPYVYVTAERRIIVEEN